MARHTDMGTRNNPAENDCYYKALPDEEMFTLLARDIHAPWLIREWARIRQGAIDAGVRPPEDKIQVTEALLCADKMELWRKQNDGRWRKKGAWSKSPDNLET